jgi:1-acyl-sn-glycerol-3-phosphate acyltransferase
MLQDFRNRQPGSPIWRIAWWHVLHFICFIWFLPAYRYRAWGVQRIPSTGSVLFVSNHQSFLDPIAVGLGAHKRQFCAMARSTLFGRRSFAWLIESLNAIPVERGTSDMAAMRQCLDVLKRDHALLIFPEGTRTPNGTTQPFATGTMLLIRRARPTVVPVAIEGTFAIWPRKRLLPRCSGRVGVMYGQPIEASRLLAMDGEQALTLLRDTVEQMRLEVAIRISRR